MEIAVLLRAIGELLAVYERESPHTLGLSVTVEEFGERDGKDFHDEYAWNGERFVHEELVSGSS